MRSKLGRTAGMCVECVGVVWDCATGVVGVERYTIPVPVRGLSLAPLPGADEEDELRAFEDAKRSPRAGAGISAYPAAPLRTTYDSQGSSEPIMRSAAYENGYAFAQGPNAYGRDAERNV